MGAWGHGSFDNDPASDWLGELEDDDAALVETLDAVANAAGYVEVDDASAALAAAEIVVAAQGRGQDRLSDDAARWLASHREVALGVDLEVTRRAVERVWEDSELRELWDDEGEATGWHAEVGELRRRLRARAS
jgi:hypothetical protein